MTDFMTLETTELVKWLAEVKIDRLALVTELRSRDDLEAAYVEVIPQMNDNANFFIRGMRLLVDFQCVEAIDVLIPFTDSQDDDICKYATQAFEELRAIYATVTDDDVETRVSWLVKGLDERDNKVDKLAKQTLAEFGEEAVPALLDSFAYTNDKELIGVLYVLKDIGYYDESMFESLKALLYRENYSVIYAVLNVMESLMPKSDYLRFYKEYRETLKPHHDELKKAVHEKREANAAKQKSAKSQVGCAN